MNAWKRFGGAPPGFEPLPEKDSTAMLTHTSMHV